MTKPTKKFADFGKFLYSENFQNEMRDEAARKKFVNCTVVLRSNFFRRQRNPALILEIFYQVKWAKALLASAIL